MKRLLASCVVLALAAGCSRPAPLPPSTDLGSAVREVQWRMDQERLHGQEKEIVLLGE